MAKRKGNDLSNVPITVSLGNVLLDWGMAGDLPKALLWFYRYLASDGEGLGDRETMPLVLMIALKEGRNGYGLRLTDLPSTTPKKTLED